ncbi:MAG: HAD-IIIA family hydrolase [Chloroflexota bacterium]|nr:HAD-IIIA family hydrolase [Chloroflexota bacterium]
MSRPAAFLDRDGTLNVRPAEHDYMRSADQFRWLPGAICGAARLASAGYALVVVSNQRGLARGLITYEVLWQIEARIQDALERHGCRAETFRYCPHDLDARCACRKPRPGLLLSAAADLDLDLAASWMIGDTESDIGAGRAAGCRTALVGTGTVATLADLEAPSLDTASELILSGWPRRAA